MPNEVQDFTVKERTDAAYLTCVGGMTGIGFEMGVIAGGQALPGAAAGLLWGLLTCQGITKLIKKKILSSDQKLEDPEILTLMEHIRIQRPYMSKSEALRSLAFIRMEVKQNPEKYQQVTGLV